jgi:hypothetical protein
MDAFTTSESYPYARRYRLGDETINYIRNSVKIVIDAYIRRTLIGLDRGDIAKLPFSDDVSSESRLCCYGDRIDRSAPTG